MIDDDHKRQFDFIRDNNIVIGSRLRVRNIDGIRIKTIKWINPFYGWFGETDQIKLSDIIEVL